MKVRLDLWASHVWIALLWATSACVDHRLAPPFPVITGVGPTQVFEPRLQLDVLFAIDDSKSMRPLVESMTRNFPAFMEELQHLPTGLPDLHVAVVSTDLGAGTGCKDPSKEGRFQVTARPAAGQTTCPVPHGNFITATADGRGNNFDGDIKDVFACIANLTENGNREGCGYEHQLESVRRALGGSPGAAAPAENDGFLRPGALLAVVWLTNEDDCSAPPGSDLFDPSRTDGFGAVWSFRCNEFGHTCNGAKLNRGASAADLDCRDAGPADREPWQRLYPVSEYVDFFKSLKPANRFLPVVISAPAKPYRVLVTQGTVANLPPGSPYVDVSCGARTGPAGTDTVFGDPAVRMQALASAFAVPQLPSICDPDYHRVMADIGKRIAGQIEACAPERLVDADPEREGVQADCAAADYLLNENRDRVREPDLSPCGDSGAIPADANGCWRVVDSTTCTSGRRIEIKRVPGAEDNHVAEITCAVCPPGGPPSAYCP